MTEALEQLGYVLDRQTNVWHRSGYEGINYNDGDEVETRIAGIVGRAVDITVLSAELRQQCTDWPSLYHLSGTRANILRPFESSISGDVLEIGAGCGAITRYLGECGASVLALEGSPRRAAIARDRTRDLGNVTVLTEKFDEFRCDRQFDVITLIGVLEYANLFTEGSDPAHAMLTRVRALLKPEGRLIIAIENQLGLKYFAGASEDHVGIPMYGIEGRYRKQQPQTYGRKALRNLLEKAGFNAAEFLAPFPDYKLPVSILTEEAVADEGFDAAAFAWQSVRRDPQLPAHSTFSQELAWPAIFRNGLGLDVANSFLVVASPGVGELVKQGVLAYHYSSDRIARYWKETRFERFKSTGINVSYQHPYAGSISNHAGSEPVIRFACPDRASYTYGTPLSWEFIQIVTRDGWHVDEVGQFLTRYISILEKLTSAQGAAYTSEDLSSATLPGEFFDVIPQNIIIRTDGHAEIIDKEWTLCQDVKLPHLLFRALLLMLGSVTRLGHNSSCAAFTRIELINAAFNSIGIPLTEKDYSRFIESESVVQELVTGRPRFEFLNWWPTQPLPMYNLGQAFVVRDQQVAALNNSVADLSNHITNLNQLITSLNQAIGERDAGIAERDAQIAQLNEMLSERDARIASILNTRSWRITAPLRFIGRQARRADRLLRRCFDLIQGGGGLNASMRKAIAIYRREGVQGIKDRLSGKTGKSNYSYRGFSGYTYFVPRKPDDLDRIIAKLKQLPRFSVVVPVYNTPSDLLAKMVESVMSQWYPHWELILADDASTSAQTREDLAALNDQRIAVLNLPVNQGIAGATNAALSRATGDFVVLLDHDDELTDDCLLELALCINRENPDYIYSDEDKISPDGSFTEPHFKPDWSPDSMMSTMYVCHVSCIRRTLLEQVGGLRSEYDGCQDWDLVLRLTEKTNRIAHIPKVLYHWRIIPASIASDIAAKSYVLEASKRVREDALKRRGLSGLVEPIEQVKGYFRVRYDVQGDPLISIIIPTRDNCEVLRRCVDSIVGLSSYTNFELVIIDNGSTNTETLHFLDEVKEQNRIRVIRHDAPFNFSELNNLGVAHARGEIMLFLNDDTEVLGADWLQRMAGYAQLDHVGAVGAKLLYPGGREIQHAGILNLEDGPGHAFLRQAADATGYYMRNLLEYNWLAVTGACLMVERRKFESIGGFDETLPIAYNDVELCFRLHEAGFYNVVCQSVSLIHHESVSRGADHLSAEKRARLERDKRRLFTLHPDYFQYDPFHSPNLHPNGINFEIAA